MSSTRIYDLAVPAEACQLRLVRVFAREVLAPVSGTDLDRLVLALDEACSNVIRHRCATIDDGMLRVRTELEVGRVRFRIGRFCQPADVAVIKPRPDDERPGGRGTAFIAGIMDRVAFEPEPGAPDCLTLVMERRLAPPNGA